ncbi:uncharacterized protein BDZ99DRAFT_499086 [Mytilinidion resinicola]|uniref:WSC domain-containing protein n=1 Tax=Mytilinidion resinicola TaxID=574789 RepID=A0A6A6YLY9_9PEZI|nr:uncharacterized protein BDZ99DRAFT_499086 [Mytilinidion resinicola]KAF2809810.1 hypothetical protein BDZ99DRAFT_499086 [Mytilinidion resinicola]
MDTYAGRPILAPSGSTTRHAVRGQQPHGSPCTGGILPSPLSIPSSITDTAPFLDSSAIWLARAPAMKTSIVLSLVAIARHVASTRLPEYQWDPASAADCVEWENIDDDSQSCEGVRAYYGITPEEFHKWNPSVGLDCKPWWIHTSYCIVTQERLDNRPNTTTSSSTTATPTSSTSTLGPSPTAWIAMGCYVEDSKLPILEQNVSPAGGNVSLTVPNCKESCYRRAYGFAGVQAGNQCWCGTYVGGEWASNQTDCNTPCTGDKKTFCGGKGLVNVFQAQENQAPASTTGTGTVPATSTSTAVSIASASKTGGAVRNMAVF